MGCGWKSNVEVITEMSKYFHMCLQNSALIHTQSCWCPKALVLYTSVSLPLWDLWPVIFFSKDEGPVPTNLLVNTFTIFLSSYIKLTQVFIINYGIIIKSISTLTYKLWHVDKYKITFKFVISHWTNEMCFSTHSQLLFSSEYFHYKIYIHEKCLDNRFR